MFYFEVPDTRYTLERDGYWDILYEHCSCFTDVSLAATFRAVGFDVLGTSSAYEGQFLQIEARAGRARRRSGRCERSSHVGCRSGIQRADVRRPLSGQDRSVATGTRPSRSGRPPRGAVGCRDQGRDVFESGRSKAPGRGVRGLIATQRNKAVTLPDRDTRLVSPESLADEPCDVVVLMNPAYTQEVGGQLNELGVNCELKSV